MGKVKVLIIDDDPIVSFIHKSLVVKRNICSSPKNFSNGIEALDFLHVDSSKEQDTHYLILLDINMPLMNGWEFLDALKDMEVARRAQVVVVTSSPDKEDWEKANNLDLVAYYIEKPLANLDPVKKIKRKIEEKIYNTHLQK